MNRSQLITLLAGHLLECTNAEAGQFLEVLLAIMIEELCRPGGQIRLEGFGRLYVEEQRLSRPTTFQARDGVSRATRFYFRFRPAAALHRALLAAQYAQEDGDGNASLPDSH